jgi:hypothetical protein
VFLRRSKFAGIEREEKGRGKDERERHLEYSMYIFLQRRIYYSESANGLATDRSS